MADAPVDTKERRKETEEERKLRKEKERAERKAKEQKSDETEEERRARKERERSEKKAKEKREETEEERKARKEKERAERKEKERRVAEAAEASENGGSKKERHSSSVAEGAANGEGGSSSIPANGHESSGRKETEEERRARKEKERVERKSREKREETEEERRVRKERERAERKEREKAERAAADATSGESHAAENASRHKSNDEGSGKEHPYNQHNHASERPVSRQHEELLAAMAEENREAARSALQSREAETKAKRREQEEAREIADAERRERRRREKEERRQQRKSEENSAHGAGLSNGASSGGAAAVALDTASLQRQGYRAQFSKDLARAMAVRRLVDLDDTAAVLIDNAPQSEYELYMRGCGSSGRVQAGMQAPPEEDKINVEVQAERVKRRNRNSQVPDDLGLYPEGLAERQAFGTAPGAPGAEGGGEAEEDKSEAEAKRRKLLAVDAGLLGSFLSRVFPVMNSLLDDNSAAGGAAGGASGDGGKTRSGTSFSSSHVTLCFSGARNRPVTKTVFSTAAPQLLACLHGARQERGPSPDMDRYASIVLLWNIFDSSSPERVLVSHSTITSICLSPSRPHLIYGGTDDGCVCVWDTREADKQHFTAGRYQRVVCRLPSYSSSWQADNHLSPVVQVCVAGYNTAVGVRQDEHEQLASLDEQGQTKFWVVNDKEQSKAIISDTDYGLNMFSTVRLHLTTTRSTARALELDKQRVQQQQQRGRGGDDSGEDERAAATSGVTSSAAAGGGSGAASSAWLRSSAAALDFAPSDPSHFVIATSEGVQHFNRFGSVAAPDMYAPSSHFFDAPVVVPSCVRYNTLDSRILLVGYADGTVRLYQHTESHPQLTLSLGASPIVDVRCSSSTKWVSWALDESGTLHLMDHSHKDREDTRLSQTLTHADTGVCLCLDIPVEEKADSRLLALGFEKGMVQLHTLDNGKLQTPASDRNDQWL